MFVFLNGQIVPKEEATVSIFDRGFLYGDGLFETIRCYGGRPFRWADHLERLERGAAFLEIPLPFRKDELREQAARLVERNQMPECLLRLTLSRGTGLRGYSPRGAEHPTLVMALHPAPDVPGELPPKWRTIISSFRLSTNDPLAQFKTCNKLPQVLARAEAETRGADEALLLNSDGEVVEACSANLFWVGKNGVCTPPIAAGALAGVTRRVVLGICPELGLVVQETGIAVPQLHGTEGVFLTLASRGVVEVTAVDGQELPRSPRVREIHSAYVKMTGRQYD
jgi:branched-chain amino acid aminotransferase